MLIRLLCAHEMTKHVCEISCLNSKRLLRKLQKMLEGYFILPHTVWLDPLLVTQPIVSKHWRDNKKYKTWEPAKGHPEAFPAVYSEKNIWQVRLKPGMKDWHTVSIVNANENNEHNTSKMRWTSSWLEWSWKNKDRWYISEGDITN